MRFSTIFVSAVVAALSVHAQANNGTATTDTVPAVSGTEAPNAAQQSAAACLLTCRLSSFRSMLCSSPNNPTGASNDNNCRAKCQALANAVNPIADCQAACPKGDGGAAANDAYKSCISNCAATAAVAPLTTAQQTSAPVATSTPTGSEFFHAPQLQVTN
jgi:hypothetical protein